MKNFEHKTTWRSVMESKPVLIILGILTLFFAWSVIRFWAKMEETSKNKTIVEDKVAALEEKKQALQNEIKNLNTEEGKEEFFRENYGLAKTGEQMIVVVEEKKPEKPQKQSSFSGILSFFRNLFK